MSCGWPMRPSGVWASYLLAHVAFGDAGGVKAFGFDHAGIDGVDADFAGAQFLGERPRDGIHRGFGRAVNRTVRRGVCALTMELMLTTLPPAG